MNKELNQLKEQNKKLKSSNRNKLGIMVLAFVSMKYNYWFSGIN